MTVSSYPHMKEDKARSLHRRLHKSAYPKTYEGPAVGPEDLAKILGAGRIKQNG